MEIQEIKVKKTADMKKYRDEYNKAHKETIQQKQKDYYVKNKAKWDTVYIPKMSTHIRCDVCDCEVIKKNVAVHRRSAKHVRNETNTGQKILDVLLTGKYITVETDDKARIEELEKELKELKEKYTNNI
ncbi:MAG: hypothetical protein P4L35_07810 [Ignavibacteriaceae bacterium]|nr:hypothetical protein [Ignavibacteriaceae bacterium]